MFIEYISHQKVRGLIKHATHPQYEEEMRALLRAYGIPYIILNDFWGDSREDYLIIHDECAAMELAIQHLAQLGHKRIAIIDSAGWTRTHVIDAFFKSAEQFGLPCSEEHVLLCDVRQAPPLGRLFWDGGLKPTAIVTLYAMTLFPMIDELLAKGMDIPGDVSVLNLNGCPLEMPGGLDVTAPVPPIRRMVDQALTLIEKGLDPDHVRHYRFKSKLHIGNTTGVCREERPVDIQSVEKKDEKTDAIAG
jgi:LacI family transcriptional regulator